MLNVQRTFPVLRSNARSSPSPPPAKPRPLAVTRHAAALGLRRHEFPHALAGRDVDRADRAVVVPVLERLAEAAVLEPEVYVAEHELPLLLRRRQLLLDQHRGGLGRGVEDVVRLRVVGGRRVVEAAERRREDRHGLPGPQRRMLDAVDHLDALVERLAGRCVEREPDAFHRRDRDDAVRLPADLAGVDERRLRRRRRPTGCRTAAAATTSSARSSGRRRSASRCAGSPRAAAPGSRAASPSRYRNTACLTSCRRSSASTPRRRRRCATRAATTGSRAEPSRTALGQAGFRSVVYAITKPRIPYSEPAAPTITRWFAQIGALVSE